MARYPYILRSLPAVVCGGWVLFAYGCASLGIESETKTIPETTTVKEFDASGKVTKETTSTGPAKLTRRRADGLYVNGKDAAAMVEDLKDSPAAAGVVQLANLLIGGGSTGAVVTLVSSWVSSRRKAKEAEARVEAEKRLRAAADSAYDEGHRVGLLRQAAPLVIPASSYPPEVPG